MMYGLIRNGKEADQADEIVTESEIEEILEHPFDPEEGK
jgi:hypothetical protein